MNVYPSLGGVETLRDKQKNAGVRNPCAFDPVAVDMQTEAAWPSLEPARWAPTKRTLHLISQMLGKVRLALAPHQPNFAFTALAMTPRGFTTGPIPLALRLVELRFDAFDATIQVMTSDGRRRELSLSELRTIAATYHALVAALRALDVEVRLSPIPQEIPDQTPLDCDEGPTTLEPDHARDWLNVMSATQATFERWRAHFFGRSAVHLWWGAFDLALALFNGNHADPPSGRGYLFTYDLDAETMAAGFYPGDDANAPFYYGYIYPEPPRCSEILLPAAGASWSQSLREWVLPYEDVRRAADPEGLLASFLDGVYDACCSAAHWDRARYTYVAPPLRSATNVQASSELRPPRSYG